MLPNILYIPRSMSLSEVPRESHYQGRSLGKLFTNFKLLKLQALLAVEIPMHCWNGIEMKFPTMLLLCWQTWSLDGTLGLLTSSTNCPSPYFSDFSLISKHFFCNLTCLTPENVDFAHSFLTHPFNCLFLFTFYHHLTITVVRSKIGQNILFNMGSGG